MRYDTKLFGSIEVESTEIIQIPKGLIGFSDCTKFVFIDKEDFQPFRILQSLDNPLMSLLVINPLLVKPDFSFDVTRDDLKLVISQSIENMGVYVTAQPHRERGETTINLQGPIVINPKERIGHQFALTGTKYGTNEKFEIETLKSC